MKYFLLSVVALLLIGFTSNVRAQSGISFTTSTLSGATLNYPTCLAFGPDNRLYVTQQDGGILAYTVQKSGPNSYTVTNTETINLVKNIPNHDDRGNIYIIALRQVTGLVVTGTAANPVLYIASSDPRIGGGGELGDIDLDTNSGMISKLVKNGGTWTMTHLVRGLPRAEENHSPNGLFLDEVNNILYIAQGGNTNAGAPSNNFGFLGEYALSAAILEIDLDVINNQFGGSYTLPTLDDPTRPNNPDGSDLNDPFGGNDGLNQAKLVPGGPVQIYAPGFRLSYDMLITKTPGKAGRMYTIGNGGNPGWGGYPENENTPDVTNEYNPAEPGSTAPTLTDDVINNRDGLHLVTRGYYGGHPVPIRANPAGAGWSWFDNNTNQAHFELSPTVDWPPYPISMANPVEADFRNAGVDDGALYTWNGSTNGMAEYTSSAFFNGAMQGDLLAASWDSGIHRIELSEDGTSVTRVTKLFTGFGQNPLDVIAQGDDDVYPGTIWSIVYGEPGVTIFEPVGTPMNCTGDINNFNLDDDGDGYSNGDETLNNTDPCSAASKPADFDLDFVSDLRDDDDDNDGINDIMDRFALDTNNGRNTVIPLDYAFLNGDPGFGLFGLGQTGLMTNYVDNYADNFDPNNPALIAGGAVGALSVPAQPGDAVTNNQKYAFQFGIPISQSVATFTLHSRLLGAPFFGGASGAGLGTQSFGIYFGNGDQDNYFKFVLHANNGNPGFQILCEQGGVVVNQQMIPVANILSTSQIDLFIEVNAVTGAVQCRYQNSGTPIPVSVGQPFTVSGNLLTLLASHTDGVAVGVISSSGNRPQFSPTWDFMRVTTTTNTPQLTNVIRINAGGGAQNFNGEAWVADQYSTGGSTYSTPNAISSTDKDALYQTERFGNFSYAIPVGQAGTYAVDLHFAEIYWTAAGQRLFNINIENGQFVRNNMDLFQTIGSNYSAYVLRADNLNITDGTINITFTTVTDNAKISGIAVGRYNATPTNTPPVVAQTPAPQSVPSTQATVVLQLGQIFNDDGGVNNLTFSIPSNTNAALLSNTQISGTQLTLTLSGTTGMGTITLRATDASNASVETTFQLTVTPPTNTPPVVIQAPAPQSVPSTQANVVLQLNQIFNDNGGVANLTFSVPNNTNPGLISNTQIVGTQLTFTLSGVTGNANITLRATDAGNASVETIFQLTVTPPSTPTLTNVIRINAGGGAQNFSGETWVADQYSSDGFTYSTPTAIAGTEKDALYQTERFGNFSYAIPVGQAGTYAVDLHFAEIYWTAPGQRLFNINIENGQFVRNNFDIFQTVGANYSAYVLRADNLNITDGTINITFTTVTDNAKISGIAVGRYSTPPANAAPTVAQAPAPQSVPSTQATVVLQLGQIFSDDGGLANLSFSVPNNTNAALISNTQIVGSQLTFTLSGTTGQGTITLRATDTGNASVETTFQLTVTPPANTPPVVVQAPAPQNVTNAQSTVVLQLAQIFNDNGGVDNLTFSVPNNTNSALISNTQIVGTQLTFTLSGTTGSANITLRATDAANAFVETVFQLTVTSSAPVLTNVIRINAGGGAQNFNGEAWVGDQYSTDGFTYSTPTAIAGTTKDALYQTERFGNFSYAIPVGQAGTYAVDLHFAEIYWTGAGQRLFNINIENGQFVRTNLDLFQSIGANYTAFVLRADNLNITDGTINITFTTVTDNAKISGIAVSRYSGGGGSDARVAVSGAKPVVQAPQNVTLQEGQSWTYQVQATDPDGDELTYSTTNLPASLYINSLNGLIKGTIERNAGTYPVTVKVTDRTGLSSEAKFIVTIAPAKSRLKEADIKFVAYPNPTENSELTVRVEGKRRDNWNFTILDFAGKQTSLGAFALEKGIQEVKFDLVPYHLSAGLYYLAVENSEGKKVIKVAVQK